MNYLKNVDVDMLKVQTKLRNKILHCAATLFKTSVSDKIQIENKK